MFRGFAVKPYLPARTEKRAEFKLFIIIAFISILLHLAVEDKLETSDINSLVESRRADEKEFSRWSCRLYIYVLRFFQYLSLDIIVLLFAAGGYIEI